MGYQQDRNAFMSCIGCAACAFVVSSGFVCKKPNNANFGLILGKSKEVQLSQRV